MSIARAGLARFGVPGWPWNRASPPDTISTDLHRRSRLLSNATMDVTMSKMLALGMPLHEVVHRSTWRPAQVIGRPELGHLSVGAEADVAVLELVPGEFRFVDSTRSTRPGPAAPAVPDDPAPPAELVWDLNGRSFPDWRETQPAAWRRE